MEKRTVQREITIILPLEETARDFKYQLEFDSYDDVYHEGYRKKDIKDLYLSLPQEYEFVHVLFPGVVAQALEDCERNSWAAKMRKTSLEALKEALEKIDLLGGGAEYLDLNNQSISEKAGITNVEIDETNDQISITIINPEHLINAVISGVGYFSPDLDAYEEASMDEIKRRFHNLERFFDVYGESKPTAEVSSQWTPDVDEESFKEEIKFRINELTVPEIAECLKEAKENSDLSVDRILELAHSYTNEEIPLLRKEVVKLFDAEVDSLHEEKKEWE